MSLSSVSEITPSEPTLDLLALPFVQCTVTKLFQNSFRSALSSIKLHLSINFGVHPGRFVVHPGEFGVHYSLAKMQQMPTIPNCWQILD